MTLLPKDVYTYHIQIAKDQHWSDYSSHFENDEEPEACQTLFDFQAIFTDDLFRLVIRKNADSRGDKEIDCV